MTEEKKNSLTAKLIGWARKGGKLRRLFALAAVFAILLYYHSMGKDTNAQLNELYGE